MDIQFQAYRYGHRDLIAWLDGKPMDDYILLAAGIYGDHELIQHCLPIVGLFYMALERTEQKKEWSLRFD